MSGGIDRQIFGEKIHDRLRLLTFPLAVRFIADPGKEIPANCFRPSVFGKRKSMTLCQGFTLARRSGATVAFTKVDATNGGRDG